MAYQKCERLLCKIDEAYREYGKNRLFLLGDNLNDIFFRDIKSGAYSILENLKYYVETTPEFKWFIYIPSNAKISENQNNIQCFKKENHRLVNKDIKEYHEQKMNKKANAFLDRNKKNKENILDKKEDDDDEKVQEAIDNLEGKFFDNIIRSLYDVTRKEEVVVYIENFDWLAEFYDEQNLNMIYIKKILELDKLKRHLVILSLKQIETLEKRFFSKFDDKEVLNIGNPNKKEIELMLHRISWKELGEELSSLEYDMLASQLSNSNYSLRECSKIFRKKLKEYGEKLKLENFNFKSKVEEKVFWKDVILDDDTKNRVKREVEEFLKGESEIKKGAILTGPPGTGKTFIAKAVANEGKVYFMCPKLSDLKGQYVGQSAPKIKALFEEARQNEPTLIFLDEVDTLFPLRDSDDGDSYTKDITNEFLQQLDGVNTGTQKIFILTATNRIESIDPAIRSRLGNPIEIGLPKEEEREILFKLHLKDSLPENFWKKLSSHYYKDLKKRSAEMSGRDIKNFCSFISKMVKDIKNLDANTIYLNCFILGFKERKKSLVNKLKSTTGISCLYPNDIQGKKIIGIDKIKNRISDIVKQVKEEHKQRRDKFDLDLQNGVLLYGPPGNGKRKIVEEVAKEQNTILIKIESKDIIGYSTRDTLENLDNMFLQAIQLSKVCEDDEGVIIFFDEFDSLVGLDMSSTLRGTILGRLSDKKGVRSNDSKLILIGATNFYEKIDEAVKRKGRFDVHLLLDNPKEEIALKLIKEFLGKEKIYLATENSESSIIKEIYNDIKKYEFQKQYDLLLKTLKNSNIGNKEEIQERIDEAEKKFRVSSSTLKSEVIELKRFIIENKEVTDKIFLTDEILKKYQEDRVELC